MKHVGAVLELVFAMSYFFTIYLGKRMSLYKGHMNTDSIVCPRHLNTHGKGYRYASFHFVQ